MGKYLFYALGLVLVAAAQLRADVTVPDGKADTFAAAVSNTITAGGGTIFVTTPILIGDTNGNFDARTFDGQSKVIVSGGNTNSIFIVNNGNLVLSNMTLTGGVGQFGGAMAISTAGDVTLIGCTFANNRVSGADGESADSDTNATGRDVAVGRNGSRGTAGEPAYGGAIYNLGSLELFQCKFLTNSATGGTGGDGSDGEDAGTRGGNGGSGGAGGAVNGGAVFHMGSVLVISNCTFSGNTATGGSGGIGGLGGSAIIGGVNGFAGATGTASGGGLYTASTNALVLSSTFDHNTVQGGDGSEGGTASSGAGQAGPRGGDALGGGIENSGFLLVTNATFYQNSALGGAGGDGGVGGVKGGNGGAGGSAIGGGIYNSGDITVVNCTFSKETASGGDAGSAGSGAGAGKNGKSGGNFGGHIANVAKKKHGAFHLLNSILGTSLSGNGGYGTIADGGYNLSADKSIKFKKKSPTLSQMNTNALFGGGDLADNGGPTLTIALSTNSPAVDFIPSDLTLTNDQRGFPRPIFVKTNQSDAGAFEVDPRQVVIRVQPTNTTVTIGSNATFSVAAEGLGPLFYQWFFQGSAISNAIAPVLTITNVQPANEGSYFVTVTNSFNAATSGVVTLSTKTNSNAAPFISQQPVPLQIVPVGTTVGISVTVTSSTPVFYQWYFQDLATNTFLLAGATTNFLTIANAQVTNSGLYELVATNISGSVTSSASTLLVTNVSTDTGNPGDPGDPGFPGFPGAANTIRMPSLWGLPMQANVLDSAMPMADAEPNPPARKVSARMIAASSSPEPRRLAGLQMAVVREFDRRWIY